MKVANKDSNPLTNQEGVATCPVCNGLSRSIRGYEYSHTAFSGLNLFSCEYCELAYANPMPDYSSLEAYNRSYFQNAHQGLNMDPEALRFFSGIAKIRAEHIMNHVNSKNKQLQRILEIGPGHAFLFQHFKERIPEVHYVSVESDLTLHEYQNSLGIEVHTTTESIKRDDFDLVIASHVLEHISTPISFLRSLNYLINPEGMLFLEVPCRDYLHKEVDEPHLIFFDKPSLKIALEKSGFGKNTLSYHGRSINSLISSQSSVLNKGIILKILNRTAKLYDRIKMKMGCANRGPEYINDAYVWSILKSHEAHLEKHEPSWWLRAIAHKEKAL